MDTSYTPASALTVLSGIFLALGAISFLIVLGDIIIRKGWRSMMGIMIPVYPINAAYLGPLTLYIYFKYGRAAKPTSSAESSSTHPAPKKRCHDSSDGALAKEKDLESLSDDAEAAPGIRPAPGQQEAMRLCHKPSDSPKVAQTKSGHRCSPPPAADPPKPVACCSSTQQAPAKPSNCCSSSPAEPSKRSTCHSTDPEQAAPADDDMAHCQHHSTAASRPYLATVLVGVSHCGAGCVLGDLVGEWLVFGTGATINGQSIWVELLVDYAFALLFGIIFQYFSIAPMSGEYGPKTVWRAAKADILSLTSFEVGAFGWMVAYQVGIWGYKLEMTTWTYWWMMQVGMAMGFATGVPVNWFLLKWKIKEPCC